MSFILLGILNSQAAGEFDPASLNPDIWLDASDATTITESSGKVSQWSNKGSKPDFSQGTSADQPTTGVATLNGLNVIDFDDDFLSGGGANSDWKFLHDGTTYFFCAALRNQKTAGRSTILGSQDGGGGEAGIFLRFDDSGNTLDFIVFENTGAVGPLGFEDNTLPTTNYEVYSLLADPANPTIADRGALFVNDTQSTDTNTRNGTAFTGDPADPLRIGAEGDKDNLFGGQIAELIIVTGADATEANRQKVVEYLNAKWSVF